MVIALAGRRIDLPDAVPVRFPLRNVDLVRARLRTLFAAQPPGTLVCSAACGADLLALDIAGALGWRRRVVLPFGRGRFRGSSVTDRPGDWGALYDRVLDEVERTGGLLIELESAGRDPYAHVSGRVLEEAAGMAAGSGENPAAVVVWDGSERGPDDLSKSFATAAGERGMKVLYVNTLE